MFKIILLTSIGCLGATLNFAQTKNTPAFDSLLNKICNCITKEKESNTSSADNEKIITDCLTRVITEDPLDAILAMDIKDFDNDEESTKAGQKIVLALAKTCPALKNIVNQEFLTEFESSRVKKGGNGKIKGFTQDAFQYVLLEESNGKLEKYTLLYSFPGAENLLSPTGNFLEKQVSFYFNEMNLYNIKTRSFEKHRVIISMKLP
jgi:hypothetical protein